MSMSRVCLVAFIGLPAVGKTTMCHYLMEREPVPFGILHICYDNLINFNSENPTQYKDQRNRLLKLLKTITINCKNLKSVAGELQSLNIEYRNHQHNDIIILCDDNHYYRSMRYKLFQIARDHSVGYCQIYFKVDVKLALERNSVRSCLAKVPNDVIVEMCSRLETPNIIDHKWERNTLIVKSTNSYENNSNAIISYITQILDKPVHFSQLSASNSTTTVHSKVHELDLLMRKRIKTIINSAQVKNRLLAENLNDRRKETLKQFQKDMGNKLHTDLDLHKYVEMLNV